MSKKYITKDDLIEEYDPYNDPCNFIDEDEFEHKPSKEDIRMNRIKGSATQMYARYYLQDQGYNVVNTKRLTVEGESLNKEWLKRDIYSKYNGDISKLKKLLENNLKGIPDLIAIKEGSISFFEIKSNTSQVSKDQKENMNMLEREGFPCTVLKFEININIKLKE